MNDIKFMLHNKGKETTSIYLRYNLSLNGKSQPFIYFIGEIIETKYWDNNNMRAIINVRPRRKSEIHRGINKKIEIYQDVFRDIYDDLYSKGVVINKNILKSKMDDKIKGGSKSDRAKSLIEHIEMIIDRRRLGKELTRDGNKYTTGTLATYNKTILWLKEYESKLNTKIYPDDINMNFYQSFLSLMFENGKSKNYTGGRIKQIKAILRVLNKEGMTHNRIFDDDKFKTLREDSDSIYLNDNEVDTIWQLDLSGNLDLARDLFLIGCYSGMRYGNYNYLSKNNIIEGNLLKIIPVKGGGEIEYIPIHKRVQKIIDKYGGHPPPSMHSQKINDKLKKIGVEAGFLDIKNKIFQIAGCEVEVNIDNIADYMATYNVSSSFFNKQIFRITKGGIIQEEVCEKWEKIQTHTARRSFATNTYLAGVDSLSIMSTTGHKTMRNFLKYIKVSKEQHAKRMLQHNWFK